MFEQVTNEVDNTSSIKTSLPCLWGTNELGEQTTGLTGRQTSCLLIISCFLKSSVPMLGHGEAASTQAAFQTVLDNEGKMCLKQKCTYNCDMATSVAKCYSGVLWCVNRLISCWYVTEFIKFNGDFVYLLSKTSLSGLINLCPSDLLSRGEQSNRHGCSDWTQFVVKLLIFSL